MRLDAVWQEQLLCKLMACGCVVRAESGPWHGLALGAALGAQHPLCSPGWAPGYHHWSLSPCRGCRNTPREVSPHPWGKAELPGDPEGKLIP